MGKEQWQEAAGRYTERNQQQAEAEAEKARTASTKKLEASKEVDAANRKLQRAVELLDNFLAGDEWPAARQMLAASGRHIVIDEENLGGGMGIVYFLDGNGLQVSSEAMGMGAAYTVLGGGKVREPSISPATAEEVAQLALRQGATPEEILESIHRKLDEIAQTSMKQ